MSCMTWWNRVWRRLHPGKQLASVGLGWKWIQILGFMFFTLYMLYSSRFFFFRCPWGLTRFLCSSPCAWCCPVSLPRCLVGTHLAFLPVFCEKHTSFASFGDFETGVAPSGFFNLDWQMCEGKKTDFPVTCLHPFFLILGIKWWDVEL